MKRRFHFGPFLPAAALAAALCFGLVFAELPAGAESSAERPAPALLQSEHAETGRESESRTLRVTYKDPVARPERLRRAIPVLPEESEAVKKPEAAEETDRAAAKPLPEETPPDSEAGTDETAPNVPEETAPEAAEETIPDDLVLLDTFLATAYCVTGTTATGTWTTAGRTLAVNPEIIPYGTHVWLFLDDGTLVGDFYAEDTGANMIEHPYVVDIYMGEGSYDACILWGTQHVSIYTQSTQSA